MENRWIGKNGNARKFGARDKLHARSLYHHGRCAHAYEQLLDVLRGCHGVAGRGRIAGLYRLLGATTWHSRSVKVRETASNQNLLASTNIRTSASNAIELMLVPARENGYIYMIQIFYEPKKVWNEGVRIRNCVHAQLNMPLASHFHANPVKR